MRGREPTPQATRSESGPNSKTSILVKSAIGAVAVVGFVGGLASSPNQVALAKPPLFETSATNPKPVSGLVKPHFGFALPCEVICNGELSSNGIHPPDAVVKDMVDENADVARLSVPLSKIVVGRPSTMCNPNDQAWSFTNLDETVRLFDGTGITLILNVDSPNLPNMQPKLLNNIACTLQTHYPNITHSEFGNEVNSIPEHYNTTMDPVVAMGWYAKQLEAWSHGIHAVNPNAEVSTAGFANDAAMEPAEAIEVIAEADPDPTFNDVAEHPYGTWTYDTPFRTLAGKITPRGGNMIGAVSIANLKDLRQVIDSAWPNRAKNKPLGIWLTEYGWRIKVAPWDKNGITPQKQAQYMGDTIRKIWNQAQDASTNLNIEFAISFHEDNEPPGIAGGSPGLGYIDGWQTGVEMGSGLNMNEYPMIKLRSYYRVKQELGRIAAARNTTTIGSNTIRATRDEPLAQAG
jgi:hypothetical protein